MDAFNFKQSLRDARKNLEIRFVEYATAHPEMSYRELGKAFHLSLGAVAKIMQRYSKLRKYLEKKRAAKRDTESAEKHGAVRHVYSRFWELDENS